MICEVKICLTKRKDKTSQPFSSKKIILDSVVFKINYIPPAHLCSEGINYYFPLTCLWGFNDGVLPGVSLLSLCLLSGFPVDSAILFGPGLIPLM